MCIWPGSAAWLHTPELRHHCAAEAGYFHGCWFDQALSPAVKGAFALVFFQATEKARTALLWEYAFTPDVDGR